MMKEHVFCTCSKWTIQEIGSYESTRWHKMMENKELSITKSVTFSLLQPSNTNN